MKTISAFLLLTTLAGCGQTRRSAVQAGRIADGAFAGIQCETSFAKKQYAGVAYDSTGVYVHLRGSCQPEVIAIRFYLTAAAPKTMYLSGPLLAGFGLSPDDRVQNGSGHSMDSPKWVIPPVTAAAALGGYNGTFWLAWDALGMDGPPDDNTFMVHVTAMKRTNHPATFKLIKADVENTSDGKTAQQPVDWSSGERLVTLSREIVFVHDCPEGCIGCDNIKVRLTLKETGEQRVLIGSTDHAKGADGVTPSRFRGWRFRDGEKDYFISNDDMLTISQNDTTLEREQGVWNPKEIP